MLVNAGVDSQSPLFLF